MRQLLVLLSLIVLLNPVYAAKHFYSEAEYQQAWCKPRLGQIEYKLNDRTRIDCLLPTMAVEFDFANKWAECVGQSQYYGLKTNRQAACVLIMEHGEKDLKYLRRLRKVAYKKGIRTFTMKPEHICNPKIKPDCPHMQGK